MVYSDYEYYDDDEGIDSDSREQYEVIHGDGEEGYDEQYEMIYEDGEKDDGECYS